MTARAELLRAIRPRPRSSPWTALAAAIGFALALTAIATVGDREAAAIADGRAALFTVRVPPFAGAVTPAGRIGGNGAGVVIASGERATPEIARDAAALAEAAPRGPAHDLAIFAIAIALAAGFSLAVGRSARGRLVRVQLATLGLVIAAAAAAKAAMLFTAISVLAIPVAAFAIVPALAIDRTVGLAAGALAAIAIALVVPFDAGCAAILLVQALAAGLAVAGLFGERPEARARAALGAGGLAIAATAIAYPLVAYLATGAWPVTELADPARSAWLAALLGPVIATALALVGVVPMQWLAGEVTRGRLLVLGELSQPLLQQLAEKAPGTWQHSLVIANLAEPAARAIGADARLVRVGALYHDAGKSVHPKYFAENLAPGETSPHDQLSSEASFDAIIAHVTDGVATARKHRVHERVVDFVHMHHGNAVLDALWAKCQAKGNPKGLAIDAFRVPGVPPQTRETALLAICDELEGAFRAMKKPEPAAIAELVRRVVYGQLHAGRLDESGLSPSDLRGITGALREALGRAMPARPASTTVQPVSAATAQVAATVPVTMPSAPVGGAITGPTAAITGPTAPITTPAAVAATERLERGPAKTPDAFAATAPVPRVTEPRAAVAVAVEPSEAVEPQRVRPLKVSKDGLPRVELTRPSDGAMSPPASSTVVGRAAAPSSFDADAEADAADTGQHRAIKLAHDISQEIAELTVDGRHDTGSDAEPEDARAAVRRAATASEVSRELPPIEVPAPDVDGARARKRAATLPPIASLARPPSGTGPSRRAPTEPPPMELRRPSSTSSPLGTPPAMAIAKPMATPPPVAPSPSVAPSVAPSRPAKPSQPIELTQRRSGPIPLATPVPVPGERSASASAPPLSVPMPSPEKPSTERITRQRMPATPAPDDAAVTAQAMPAFASDPAIPLPPPPVTPSPVTPSPVMPSPVTPPAARTTSWATGLAARIDSQIDDDFGADTPVAAPTQAQLQALLDDPPEATRLLSIDEVQRIHRHPDLRRSEPELSFERRAPYPTTEVTEEDIEAAIEIAPSARRTGVIGIAKKKPGES